MIDRESEEMLSMTVDEACREMGGSVGQAPAVREFLMNLVRESLIYREQEWRAFNASPESAQTIRDALRKPLMDIVEGANQYAVRAENHAPLISVIEWLKDNWCGVFPFCR